MKKLLSVLLMAAMLVCGMSSFAFAQDATPPTTPATTPATTPSTTPPTTPPSTQPPSTGDQPVTPPSGGSVISPLTIAKSEANTAVSAAAAANKYDEAEQAEIAKIVEKAKADIAAAKTAEEVKAIQEAAIKEIEAVLTAEEKATIAKVESTKFVARSQMSKLNGKKAVKITWTVPKDMEFDGYDIFRSTKRYKGYGTKPFFSTTKTSYLNNKGLKKGNTYYYKVRGYKMVNGEKVYTAWSLKAWRTIK